MKILLISALANGSGKSTLAKNILAKKLAEYLIVENQLVQFQQLISVNSIKIDSFARALKKSILDKHYRPSITVSLIDSYKEVPFSECPNFLQPINISSKIKANTFRDLCIYYGQEIKKKCPGYWANKIHNCYHEEPLELLIIDDFRFREEYDTLKNYGHEIYVLELLKAGTTKIIDCSVTGIDIRNIQPDFVVIKNQEILHVIPYDLLSDTQVQKYQSYKECCFSPIKLT